MLDGIMKAFKMTCKDISPLISESQDHSLPFVSRIRLKMHLSICGLCEIYRKQLETICKLARKLGTMESKVHEEANMKPEAKEKIQRWIEEKN
jgi:hypothetical protein